MAKPARPLAVFVIALATAACAPDAWNSRQASGFNAWLNTIANACYPLQLGRAQMSEMILRNAIGDTDAYNYFLDQTSRLYYRTLSPAAYASSINGFFDGPSAAVDCVLSRLPAQP
jgi:hypothetical protein